jgi:hypothetical protein
MTEAERIAAAIRAALETLVIYENGNQGSFVGDAYLGAFDAAEAKALAVLQGS